MGPRLILLSAACWSLVAAPVLCGGGLLSHPCDCAETDCETVPACTHESECEADPCAVAVRYEDDPAPELSRSLSEKIPLASGQAAGHVHFQFQYERAGRCPANFFRAIGRPYPDSDLPLLI